MPAPMPALMPMLVLVLVLAVSMVTLELVALAIPPGLFTRLMKTSLLLVVRLTLARHLQ